MEQDRPSSENTPGNGAEPTSGTVTQPAYRAALAGNSKKKRATILRWVKRGLLAGFVLAVVALLVVASLPKPVPVDVVAAERGPMQVTVDEDGRTRVRDRYIVSAPLSGRMARLELHAGDSVKRGAIIARIAPLHSPLLDDRTRKTSKAQVAAARAAKGQTKAQLSRARATVAFAKKEAERMEGLAKGEAIPTRELERAQLAKRTAVAELESLHFAARVADYELRMARAALTRSRGDDAPFDVPSPVDGQVLKVIQENEGVVQAGTPLLELADPAALEVVVDVLTSDAVAIAAGAKVTVDAWGGPPLPATVRMVEPSAFTRLSALGVEEQRVNVVIDLSGSYADWAALKDGYRVEARIVVWAASDVLLVPASAVFRHGKEWAIYLVSDGKAALTTIKVGHRTAQHVEVLSGVEMPALVVTHPSDRITNGVEVVKR